MNAPQQAWLVVAAIAFVMVVIGAIVAVVLHRRAQHAGRTSRIQLATCMPAGELASIKLAHWSAVPQPIGAHGICEPWCSPRACRQPDHCARIRPGTKARIHQRLTPDEIETIRFAAIDAAQADHKAGKTRDNPLPRHTRAAALWGIEYSACLDRLRAYDALL